MCPSSSNRLTDIIKGQVSLIHEARNLKVIECEQKKWLTHCPCTVCASKEGLFHFHKEYACLYLTYICFTFELAMALHRGPGLNKVQTEFNNTRSPGGCRATQQLNTDTNGFPFMDADGQEVTKIDKNKGCRQKENLERFFVWMGQAVCVGWVSYAFNNVH